jgi:hypothetical protein
LIHFLEIECGYILGVWPEVLDGCNEECSDDCGEQTSLYTAALESVLNCADCDLPTYEDNDPICVLFPAFDHLVIVVLRNVGIYGEKWP